MESSSTWTIFTFSVITPAVDATLIIKRSCTSKNDVLLNGKEMVRIYVANCIQGSKVVFVLFPALAPAECHKKHGFSLLCQYSEDL